MVNVCDNAEIPDTLIHGRLEVYLKKPFSWTAVFPGNGSDITIMKNSRAVELEPCEALTGMDFPQAQRVRILAKAKFDLVFGTVDVILTPATARTAQPLPAGGYNGGWSDLSLDTEMMRYVIPGNLLGFPLISFPFGYDSRGMPVGMQAMGRHREEHLLLWWHITLNRM